MPIATGSLRLFLVRFDFELHVSLTSSVAVFHKPRQHAEYIPSTLTGLCSHQSTLGSASTREWVPATRGQLLEQCSLPRRSLFEVLLTWSPSNPFCVSSLTWIWSYFLSSCDLGSFSYSSLIFSVSPCDGFVMSSDTSLLSQLQGILTPR